MLTTNRTCVAIRRMAGGKKNGCGKENFNLPPRRRSASDQVASMLNSNRQYCTLLLLLASSSVIVKYITVHLT